MLQSVITDMLVNGAFGHVDSMIMERQENSADREMLEAIMAMGRHIIRWAHYKYIVF